MPHIHIKAYTFFNLTSISCTFYRPFPHSCKQRHQVEARVDKTQWFVWNSPPEPRPHFLMFDHWSGMRERSIRWNIIYYSQLTKNKENKTCLTMNLTLTKVHKTKKPNKLCYTGDNPDIYFLQSDSVIHFFYNLKGYIGRNIYNILLAKRMKKKIIISLPYIHQVGLE